MHPQTSQNLDQRASKPFGTTHDTLDVVFVELVMMMVIALAVMMVRQALIAIALMMMMVVMVAFIAPARFGFVKRLVHINPPYIVVHSYYMKPILKKLTPAYVMISESQRAKAWKHFRPWSGIG